MVAYNVYTSLEQTLDYLHLHVEDVEVKKLLDLYEAVEHRYRSTVVNRKYLLIVFEGLDGSGKSTMVKLAKKKIGGAIVQTPPLCIQRLRSYFDKCDPKLRRAYYSLGNYIAAMEIKATIGSQHVFMDRFWHSTAAYALAESDDDIPPVGDAVFNWPEDLFKPDAVIFLDVQENERLRRTSKRQETVEETHLREQASFRTKLNEIYTRMDGITFVESNKFPKAVFNDIMENYIKQLLNSESTFVQNVRTTLLMAEISSGGGVVLEKGKNTNM